MTIAIIGIGQSLRTDDGVGLAAIHAWMQTYPRTASDPRMRVALVELPGLGLLDLFANSGASILVDAVLSGAAPGTLHRMDMDALIGSELDSSSAHGWGVAETLQMGRQLDPGSLPERLILLGIEVENLELGEGLSISVQGAIPDLVEQIEAQINAWLD